MKQTHIEIKNSFDGSLIAQGIVGKDVFNVEGNYYFSPENVDLKSLNKKENAYHCPIKNSDCDYYFLNDENSKPRSTELCWIYKIIANSLFKQIEGKVGFYTFDKANGAVVVTKEA